MARKKLEEPEKWITVNGQHLPVYPGGVIGQPGQTPPAKKSSAENTKKPKTNREWFDYLKKTGEIDKDAEYEDFISYAPITDKEAERIVKRGKQMELADEADAYDRAHGEGKYANTTDADSSVNGKKTASMDLGNGMRLTADVSNPNKNISEVERAKKVNREKYTADKGLYQHRNIVKAEQEKAQAIANAISAKTGIANSGTKTTSRNADDIYNERKNIKGNTQEEATRREKLSEELSRTVVSGMKSGEVYKVPSGKGYEELRYVGSEMKNNRAYATFETPNKSRTGIVKEGSDLYGIQSMKSSQPATTSRNAKYDTSRANKPIPKSQVQVSNSEYMGAHGKNPSGRGTWAFFLAGSNEPLFFSGTFAEAKKKAIEEAAKRGVNKVTVGS